MERRLMGSQNLRLLLIFIRKFLQVSHYNFKMRTGEDRIKDG